MINVYAVAGLERAPSVSMTLRRRWAEELRRPVKDHPRAWAMVSSPHKRKVCCASRRAAKTESPGREAGARLIERDGYQVWICSRTLKTYSRNWLERRGGLMDLLRGGDVPHRVKRGAEGAVVEVSFPWGSTLTVVSLAHVSKIDDIRGGAFDLAIIDEAQSISFLSDLIADILVPASQDRDGEIVLTGTPGDEVGSTFEVLSSGSDPDWEAHRFHAWDNPCFGASFEERYARATARTCRTNRKLLRLSDAQVEAIEHLTQEQAEAVTEHVPDLPDSVLREAFGRWVLDPDLLVFPVKGVQEADLYWGSPWASAEGADCVVQSAAHGAAAPRLWPALIDELPLATIGDYSASRRPWRAAIGCDLGFRPDPFSLVLLAWCPGHESVHEVDSFKCRELSDSEQFELLRAWVDAARRAFVGGVGAVVVDASGPAASLGEGWRQRLAPYLPQGIYTASPDKTDRYGQFAAMNATTAIGNIRLRRNSPTDVERRHLRWTRWDAAHPSRRRDVDDQRVVTLADGHSCRPGDHALDAFRYAWVHTRPSRPTAPDPYAGLGAEERIGAKIKAEAFRRRRGR